MLLRLFDRGLAAVFGGHVSRHAEAVDRCGDRLHVGFRSSHHGDASAFMCQGLGDRQPDAFRGGGDERDLALDPQVHPRILVTVDSWRCRRRSPGTSTWTANPLRRDPRRPCCWSATAIRGSFYWCTGPAAPISRRARMSFPAARCTRTTERGATISPRPLFVSCSKRPESCSPEGIATWPTRPIARRFGRPPHGAPRSAAR